MTNVFVLTDTELGWDCVRGVFTSYEDIVEYYNTDIADDNEITDTRDLPDCYVIHSERIYGC